MKVFAILSLVSLQLIAVASLPVDIASREASPALLGGLTGATGGSGAAAKAAGAGKAGGAAQQKAVVNAANSFASDVATVSNSLNTR